ncbi:hypothetical protein OG203_11385 [Nocardia sp. NBC_01499]|uniref:hypothetical protein n=1 Tax=Nocardia sp. NBC_01499 TaxID=2903597 RepID=UPI00386E66AD
MNGRTMFTGAAVRGADHRETRRLLDRVRHLPSGVTGGVLAISARWQCLPPNVFG